MFYANFKRSCGVITGTVSSALNLTRTASVSSCETNDDDRSFRQRVSHNNNNNNRKNSTTGSILSSIKNQSMNNNIIPSGIKPTNNQPLTSKPPPGVSFQPKVSYPQWDYNWDGRDASYKASNNYNKNGGVTRHIILVRHGQYEMESSDDKLRILTPMGRQQALFTGQRLASLASAISKTTSTSTSTSTTTESTNTKQPSSSSTGTTVQPCTIKAIHVSSLTRAIETANIISSVIQPSTTIIDVDEYDETAVTAAAATSIINCTEPDPLLSETIPMYIIPDRPEITFKNNQERDDGFQQAENAFHKYIHRTDIPESSPLSLLSNNNEQTTHEFEIIVCHANIIRYFICRALQVWFVYFFEKKKSFPGFFLLFLFPT
jgi:serine/threonine-protein phosphatase PGAM5